MPHLDRHTSLRRTLLPFLTLLLLLAAPARAQQVRLGPGVDQAIDALGLVDRLQVVVTFHGDGPLTETQRGRLAGLGLSGVYFNELPIAGVVGTRAQLRALLQLDGVRSVWLNEPLTYENDGATEITGVDRLRTDPALRTNDGLPFSGRGVGVLVNDSGVDGAHPDLSYPDHLVQNVAGQTNLQSVVGLLPYTPVEDVINTDIGGGHGTHVAGTIGGTGAASGGRYEGVAPGADLIGYGSGAALFILDTIGAFDYALTHQYQYNIRVVSNSWGNTSDIGTPFNPDDPVNVATKRLADRGIVVVFSAGNSGPGEATISGNFKKAPWVVTVAAGDKLGRLADFSSRGEADQGGTVVVGGKTYTWHDRPTVTAPGVDIISARASTSSLQALSAQDDAALIDPAYLPFYTTMSGTSMACPHVAGVVALLLEANPRLNVYTVRRILERTATNIPGREGWEVGAGYVNAHAALVATLGRYNDFGATVNLFRNFNSNAEVHVSDAFDLSVAFSPVGETEAETFEVGPDVALVNARAVVSDNTVALVLIDPEGRRYGSSISLPALGEAIAVSAPGVPGTWQFTVSGIGSVSGVPLDPLGLTNGTAVPGTVTAHFEMLETGGYTGLNDVDGHPAEAFIKTGVSERYLDGRADGSYRPDHPLTRGDLARFLTMGAALRQILPLDASPTFADVPSELAPYVEAATARGAALRDRAHDDAGVIRANGSTFGVNQRVSRAELAYSFVQALGFEDVVSGYDGPVGVVHEGQRIPIEDAADIPAGLRGYVQLALDAGMLNAYFSLEQGPYDLQPTLKARFEPNAGVTRADYAVAAVRFGDAFGTGFELTGTSFDGRMAETTSPLGETAVDGEAFDASPSEVPAEFALEQNYPNPFNPATTIDFSMPENGPVRLAVYNLLGQQVRVLLDRDELAAGRHTISFEAGELASGTYLYRLESPGRILTRQMTLLK